MNKNRTISIIRLSALLGVIFCHMLEQYYVLLGTSIIVRIIGNYLATGVQVFLLISGYLYGEKYEQLVKENNVPYVLKNVWKILKDYYLYLALIAIPICFYFDRAALTVKNIMGGISTWCTFGKNNHLWFVPYILLCYILSPMVARIREWMRRGNELALLCAFIACYIFVSYVFKAYFIPEWVVCYFLGFFAKDIMKSQFWNRIAFFSLTLICVGMNFIRVWLMYIKYPNDLYTEGTFFDIIRMCYRWSQVLLAILLFICMDHLVGNKKAYSRFEMAVLDFSDKFSYDIYLCHMVFVKGWLSTLMLTKSIALNVLITLTLSTILGMLLYYVSNSRFLVRKQ